MVLPDTVALLQANSIPTEPCVNMWFEVTDPDAPTSIPVLAAPPPVILLPEIALEEVATTPSLLKAEIFCGAPCANSERTPWMSVLPVHS